MLLKVLTQKMFLSYLMSLLWFPLEGYGYLEFHLTQLVTTETKDLQVSLRIKNVFVPGQSFLAFKVKGEFDYWQSTGVSFNFLSGERLLMEMNIFIHRRKHYLAFRYPEYPDRDEKYQTIKLLSDEYISYWFAGTTTSIIVGYGDKKGVNTLFEKESPESITVSDDIRVFSDNLAEWIFDKNDATDTNVKFRTCNMFSLAENDFKVSPSEGIIFELNSCYDSIMYIVFDDTPQCSGTTRHDAIFHIYTSVIPFIKIFGTLIEKKSIPVPFGCGKLHTFWLAWNSTHIDIGEGDNRCSNLSLSTTLDYEGRDTTKKITDVRFSVANQGYSDWKIRHLDATTCAVTKTILEEKYVNKSVDHCQCYCNEPIDINEVIEEIKIDKKNTSRYRRRLGCAPDSRLSSKAMGLAAAVVIVTVVGSLVALDFHNLSSAVQNFLANFKHK